MELYLHFPVCLHAICSDSFNFVFYQTCYAVFVGDLSVENFFKEVTHSHLPYVVSGSSSSVPSEVPVVDNVLVRLESVQVSRAVMTLAGSLEIQVSLVRTFSFKN